MYFYSIYFISIFFFCFVLKTRNARKISISDFKNISAQIQFADIFKSLPMDVNFPITPTCLVPIFSECQLADIILFFRACP